MRRRWGCFLVCGTEVFQSNAFNRHRHITTILFILNLVCKSEYYMFCIITTAQHILEIWTTIECLSARVSKVISSNNLYMWYFKCKFLNLRNVEVLIKLHNWWLHHENIFLVLSFSVTIVSLEASHNGNCLFSLKGHLTWRLQHAMCL